MISFVRSGFKVLLIVLAGLAIGLAVTQPAVAKLWNGPQPITWVEPRPPVGPVSIADSPYEGNPNASLIIIEYTDFECPSCRRFATEVLPAVRSKYIANGTVGFVLKQFPIESIHPTALEAASMATCAGSNKAFWSVHDALMTTVLDHNSVSSLSVALKLDGAGFRKCLATSGPSQVRKEVAQARSLGVAGTPTFFVGRRRDAAQIEVIVRFSGARTPAYFDQVLLPLIR